LGVVVEPKRRLNVKLVRLVLVLAVFAAPLAVAPSAFAGGTATLTISPQGAGSGNVVGDGSVSGANIIDCDWNGASTSGTCTFDSGGLQSIQLAATPAGGSDFITWTNCPGAVSSGGTVCTYAITGSGDDFTIQPRFELEDTEAVVTVVPEGPGSGTVAGSGSVSGTGIINCAWNGAASSGTCSFGSGGTQSIQLAFTPAAGSNGSWTNCPGAVTGGGTICTFTVDDPSDDFTVRPRFELVGASTLDVALLGSGSGSVTSNVGGINCPNVLCVVGLPTDTVVMLTATANAGSTQAGWGNACAGSPGNTCTVNVSGFTAVTVTFNLTGGGGGGACDIVGTPGNDVLIGTAADEVICGRGGNDTIRGRGGDDVLKGEAGNDTIYGEGGSDDLLGGRGKDKLYGGNGPDTATGGSGNDNLFGGAGPDVLDGKTGSDIGNGGGGVDACPRVEIRVSCP
jgi:Ca2+-binding RTX toxin-like protein